MKLCKKCGKPIDIITRRIYRTIIVDASPVLVVPDPLGEEFIRLSGEKMRGTEDIKWDDDRKQCEGVFRPHYRTCGLVDKEAADKIETFYERMRETRQ